MDIGGVGGVGNVYSSDNSPDKDVDNYNNFQDAMKAFNNALEELSNDGLDGNKDEFNNKALPNYEKALANLLNSFKNLFHSTLKDGELSHPSMEDVVSNLDYIKNLDLPNTGLWKRNLSFETNEISKMHQMFTFGTGNIMNSKQVQDLIDNCSDPSGPYGVLNKYSQALAQYSDEIAKLDFRHC